MTKINQNNQRLLKGNFPVSKSVMTTLQSFQGIRNPVLRWIVRLLPIFILPPVLLILGTSDLQYTSWVITACLVLITFQFLLGYIPQSFLVLWRRGIINQRVDDGFDEENLKAERGDDHSSRMAFPEDDFRQFICEFENGLNSGLQWLLGIFLCVVIVLSRYFGASGALEYGAYKYGEWVLWVVPIGEALSSFIVGVIFWRIIVVGIYVWQLGKKFDLTPQLGHPDQVGGLSPLGELCLRIELILIIPAIHVGFWGLFGRFLGYPTVERQNMFAVLLLIPIILSLVSFFVPLWGIHQVMALKKDDVMKRLDQMGQDIDHLSQELLLHGHELNPIESEQMAKKLEVMEKIYKQTQQYPVWPINTLTKLKFLASQVLPILGFIQFSIDLTRSLGLH